jgi:predicted NAD/FAD-dependent oxidoreductase
MLSSWTECALSRAGEHGCGGRLATRTAADASLRDAPPDLQGASSVAFDHAAQFFACSDPWFAGEVQRWLDNGWVRHWHGAVRHVTSDGAFTADQDEHTAQAAKLVAAGGMRALAEHIADNLAQQGALFRRPCWVAKMRASKGQWHLEGRGRSQGAYDAAVIAHNGKCANQLLRPAGVPRVAAQMRALRLSAIWVLMVAFEAPVATPGAWEGAFVDGSGVLAWAANNTKNLQLQLEPGQSDGSQGKHIECWTLMSTPQFGKKHKVPQENVPKEKAIEVLCPPALHGATADGKRSAVHASRLPSVALVKIAVVAVRACKRR